MDELLQLFHEDISANYCLRDVPVTQQSKAQKRKSQ
jgi:hypothetical protein